MRFCRDCKHFNCKLGQYPCNACLVGGGRTLWESNVEFGKKNNPYWERICKLSDRQRAKGMETYGQGLESNPAGVYERINHLEEELVDALMYCEWLKDWLREKETE